jgi:hypothetical protein
MTRVLLHCRDYHASDETIQLECELDARGYINFDEGSHGVASDRGDNYEFQLYNNGAMDFGREYREDQFWRTDLHELEIRVGVKIKVSSGSDPWIYEVVQVQ